MRKIFVITSLIIIGISTLTELQAKPLVGIIKLRTDSPRVLTIASMYEKHLSNILKMSRGFAIVETALLNAELRKFKCIESKCVLRFARNAGIKIIISGSLTDMGEFFILDVQARAIDLPHYGKVIYSSKIKLPMHRSYSAREYSFICEEQAGGFLAKVFKFLQMPIYYTKNKQGKLLFDNDITGTYTLYKIKEGVGPFLKDYVAIGTITLKNGKVVKSSTMLKEGNFIIQTYHKKEEFLTEFYAGRKREIIFKKPMWQDTIYALIFTAPASASMPIAAPLFGYYQNEDWVGLSLWAINAYPYLYLEYDGFMNSPSDLRKNEKNISRRRMTHHRFAWYMFLSGGLSLFVDAFSQQYLYEARTFQKRQDIMGSSLTAGYLSLVSGGGGHFYRGHRFWGYFYFHLNNILVYLTIQEFTSKETYNAQTDSYDKEKINRTRAYTYAGLLVGLKAVEIIHTVFQKENISNGKILNQSFSLSPAVYGDRENGLSYGMQFIKRF